jgi:epoxyqueuosine reductase
LKIMVHTCCAPCGTYVFKRLREGGHRFKALYFNPNIHPYDEYRRRRATLEAYARDTGVEIACEPYDAREYWQAVGQERAKPARCERCYRLRLTRTAERARAEGCEAFTTTLLISPYQEHETIKNVGEEVARATGVPFHYEDFRAGYRESRAMARHAALYCQKYCGCASSLREAK